MKHNTVWLRTGILAALILPVGGLLAWGMAGAEDEKTAAAKALAANPELRKKLDTEAYRQLKEKLPRVKHNDKTYYFAEGDLRLDDDELLFYAENRVNQVEKFARAQLPGMPSPGPTPGGLILHVVNGKIMRWSPGSTLTYCVLEKTFGGNAKEYKAVVENMTAATREWTKTCNIKFNHDSKKDRSAPGLKPPAGVTFTVRKVVPGPGEDAPIASAFFPGDPLSERHLLVFPDYFTTTFDKVGVLRHELGHVLGFRHEHIRSEAPAACQGEPLGGAIKATAYDPRSVMHYFCGGRGTRELKISVLDRKGARLVYGTPPLAKGFESAEPPLDTTEEYKNAFKDLKP
jgi:hypothetical protein